MDGKYHRGGVALNLPFNLEGGPSLHEKGANLESDILTHAERLRHIRLLEKLKEGKAPSARELEELREFESANNEQLFEPMIDGPIEMGHVNDVLDRKLRTLLERADHPMTSPRTISAWASALKAILDCKAKVDPKWQKTGKSQEIQELVKGLLGNGGYDEQA